MTPALETLMLVFGGAEENALTVPARSLFLGAQAHPALRDWPGLLGWQPLKPWAEEWDRAGFARSDEPPAGRWPLVLVLPGKSRDETLGWFALARDRLADGGTLVTALPNRAGAGRFEKQLGLATAGGVTSIQKHKCRAFYATHDGTWDEAIFEEWRDLTTPRVIAGTSFVAQPGVFSSEHVDPGSRFLADHLPASLRGKVADLGAGWGYLSNEMLRRCPKIEWLDLFEADARALACARVNLAGHTRAAITYHWHDVTCGLPATYDAVVMNPPFHSGQATDVDLGRTFLTTAVAALSRGGKLWLVANRQLPYEALLETSGLAWRRLAENAGYKILWAEKR